MRCCRGLLDWTLLLGVLGFQNVPVTSGDKVILGYSPVMFHQFPILVVFARLQAELLVKYAVRTHWCRHDWSQPFLTWSNNVLLPRLKSPEQVDLQLKTCEWTCEMGWQPCQVELIWTAGTHSIQACQRMPVTECVLAGIGSFPFVTICDVFRGPEKCS